MRQHDRGYQRAAAAVLAQAAHDAVYTESPVRTHQYKTPEAQARAAQARTARHERQMAIRVEARNFLTTRSPLLALWCHLANLDINTVMDTAREL